MIVDYFSFEMLSLAGAKGIILSVNLFILYFFQSYNIFVHLDYFC